MNKILIIDTYYPPFLENFHSKLEKPDKLSYKQMLNLLMAKKFGTADFYSMNLNQIGFNASEVVLNDELLQKRWSKENGVIVWTDLLGNVPALRIYFKQPWKQAILEAQIDKIRPDLLYCQALYEPSVVFLQKVKRKYGLHVVGQVASEVSFEYSKLAAFDLVFTSFPHYINRFQQIGIKSEFLSIGFETTILPSLKKFKKQFDVSFVGGFSRRHLEDKGFLQTFNYLAEKTRFDVWGYGKKNIPPDSAILKNFHSDGIFGLDMYNIYYNSKIIVNRHIPASENFANNMRLFEATGVGAMLITDQKDNLSDYFEVGREIETYSSKEELVEKVKYYLKHGNKREKIALAGQRKTHSQHNYRKIMKDMTKKLKRHKLF